MKKITVSKFALAGIMPVCAILPIIATSCGPKKNTHAMVSDMTPIIDPDTGGAHITAMINTQPLYDEALVSVISKKGEHLVTMYEDGGMPFSHQNSLRLPVKEHMISINLSFYDYVGESTETTFNLEIDYFDKSGKVHTEVVHNLTLSTEYSEKDKETVHILAFNDLHGAATGCGDTDFPNTSYKNPGVMRMAQTFDPILHNNPGSILLSCGDNNSGDAFSTATHGETMYPLLKSLDCRYSAVGNHAFE
ncbi:MAG: hypothetical protein MJ200_02520 [Mycoplasmoidaceae bacterium]|nr:hypothetical protein [Mycoplasmoidaceae bacterium]